MSQSRTQRNRSQAWTYVPKGAACALSRGPFQIRIVEDDGTRFPSEFQQNRFQVLARRGRHDPSDRGAAGETDFLHVLVLDQGLGHVGRIFGPVLEHVETAIGKTGLAKDGADGPIAARRELGPFQNRGVARRQRVGDRSNAQHIWSVPGRDS